MMQSFNIQTKISDNLSTMDDRLAYAYCEHGIAHISLGDYEEGITSLKKQRAIRESYGPYIPSARDASLARALVKVGKLDECDELLRESLRIREELFGKEEDTMRSVNPASQTPR